VTRRPSDLAAFLLEDLLNQCLIVLEPSFDYHKALKASSNLMNSKEANAEKLDKIVEEQSKNRLNELSTKLEQLILHRQQLLTLDTLCMWKEEPFISISRTDSYTDCRRQKFT
jgi:hypothetical protein